MASRKPARRVLPNRDIPFVIADSSDGTRTVRGRIHVGPYGVALTFEGHEDHNGGEPVYLEIFDGEVRAVLWSDINQEDPTHVVSLAGARRSCRRPAGLPDPHPSDDTASDDALSDNDLSGDTFSQEEDSGVFDPTDG